MTNFTLTLYANINLTASKSLSHNTSAPLTRLATLTAIEVNHWLSKRFNQSTILIDPWEHRADKDSTAIFRFNGDQPSEAELRDELRAQLSRFLIDKLGKVEGKNIKQKQKDHDLLADELTNRLMFHLLYYGHPQLILRQSLKSRVKYLYEQTKNLYHLAKEKLGLPFKILKDLYRQDKYIPRRWIVSPTLSGNLFRGGVAALSALNGFCIASTIGFGLPATIATILSMSVLGYSGVAYCLQMTYYGSMLDLRFKFSNGQLFLKSRKSSLPPFYTPYKNTRAGVEQELYYDLIRDCKGSKAITKNATLLAQYHTLQAMQEYPHSFDSWVPNAKEQLSDLESKIRTKIPNYL